MVGRSGEVWVDVDGWGSWGEQAGLLDNIFKLRHSLLLDLSWRNASILPDFVFGLSYPLTKIKDTQNFANKTNMKLSTYSTL